MKLLVDTAYLLPAIGISVKGVPSDGAIRLVEEGHEIYASDISIFELSAKGAKHIVERTLSGERVARGIRAIVHDGTITMIPIHDSALLLTAFKLRSMLGNFIDCLILASAMNQCDAVITEDKDIKDLESSTEFGSLRAGTNPEFKIQRLTETV